MATPSVLYPTPSEQHAPMALSADEILFLRACDPHWFHLDPEKVSTILSSAYKLLAELIPEHGADRPASAPA
jgi:hypothetical protein